MYGDVVLGVNPGARTRTIPSRTSSSSQEAERGRQARHRARRGRPEGAGRTTLQGRIDQGSTGKAFPDDPEEQLWGAIGAVFGSWNNERAIAYRAASTTSPATGARRSTCRPWSSATWARTRGTGVAFTRDPATGENELLRRVPDQRPGRGRGRRHPHARGRSPSSRRADTPKACQRSSLAHPRRSSRQHYRDMQDIEFTIEDGQALDAADPHRQAHRPGGGAHRRRHGRRGADRRRTRRSCASTPSALDQLLQPDLRRQRPEGRAGQQRLLAKGLHAGPGAASGQGRLHRRGRRGAGPSRARRSSWCASRPAPRTSAA